MVFRMIKPLTGTTKQHEQYVGNQIRGFDIDNGPLRVVAVT